MADLHDSKQVTRASRKTTGNRDTASSVTGVSGRIPDVDAGATRDLGELIAVIGVTATIIGVGVPGVLGLVAVLPGSVAVGLFSVVALFGTIAAAPSLARLALARILSRRDRSDSD